MTDYTPEALEALALEYRLTMDKDIVHSWGGDAARALADIADALRTGQLIHAVPSGDEVEAVKAGLRKCFDSERPGDDEDKALTLLANAAITALDAVRGKQACLKARENGDG